MDAKATDAHTSDDNASTNVNEQVVRDIFSKSAIVRNSTVRELHGETVSFEQSASQSVTATDLHARQTAFGQATVTSLEATSSAIGFAQVTNATLNASSHSFVVMADGDVRMDQAGAQALITRQLNEARSSAFGAVVANSVAMRDSTVGILIARNVEGVVSPQLDTRGAIIAGAVAGAVLSIVTVAAMFLRPRRSC
jgi:hypothetical protein